MAARRAPSPASHHDATAHSVPVALSVGRTDLLRPGRAGCAEEGVRPAMPAEEGVPIPDGMEVRRDEKALFSAIITTSLLTVCGSDTIDVISCP